MNDNLEEINKSIERLKRLKENFEELRSVRIRFEQKNKQLCNKLGVESEQEAIELLDKTLKELKKKQDGI